MRLSAVSRLIAAAKPVPAFRAIVGTGLLRPHGDEAGGLCRSRHARAAGEVEGGLIAAVQHHDQTADVGGIGRNVNPVVARAIPGSVVAFHKALIPFGPCAGWCRGRAGGARAVREDHGFDDYP